MDIKQAEKRFSSAFSNQDNWRDLLEDAYYYCIPERNNFSLRSEGEEENNQVYDETAPLSLPKHANRMQRALFPEAEQWIKFKSGSDISKDEEKSVDAQLETYTEKFFSHFNETNFQTEINPSLIDCGISTGVIQIDEEPVSSDIVATWSNIPLDEIAFEKPVKGRLVNCWRKLEEQANAIEVKWPKAKIPQKLSDLIAKEPEKPVKLKLGHVKEGKEYVIYLIWDKYILLTEKFKTQRIIAFRLNAFPKETFGRGPGILSLPVIRDVNTIRQLILENAAINVAGMYTARSDGVFNPYTFTVSAGGIVPVQSNDNANPSLRRLENSGDLHMGQMIIEEMQDSIRKAFFVDPLGDLSDPVRSATEQSMRMQEFLKDQGASLNRLNTELKIPLVLAFVDILTSRGKLPKVKVDGKEVKIVHNTQLVQAEKQDDYTALVTFLTSAQQTLGPEVFMATVKVEDVPEGMADMLGVSSKFLRDKAERSAIMESVKEGLSEQAESAGELPTGQ